MKKTLALSLITLMLIGVFSVSAFADTSLGIGTYSIGKSIPSGECDIAPISSPALITIKRNNEVIATNVLPTDHSFKTTLEDGDQLEVSSGEIFVFPLEEHPGAVYVSNGEYYCPSDLPSGSYKFTSLGGSFSAMYFFDLSQTDENGEPVCIDDPYFGNNGAGKSYSFTINENTKMKIVRNGYLEKSSRLFD